MSDRTHHTPDFCATEVAYNVLQGRSLGLIFSTKIFSACKGSASFDDAREDLNSFSKALENRIGRSLEADDFLRLHNNNHNFISWMDEDHSGRKFQESIRFLIDYLTPLPSCFSLEALLIKSQSGTVFDILSRNSAAKDFFNPAFWARSPDTLYKIAKKVPNFSLIAEETWHEAMKIRAKKSSPHDAPVTKRFTTSFSTPVKPKTASSENTPVDTMPLSCALGELRAKGDSFKIPSVKALLKRLEENPHTLDSCTFGDEIGKFYRDFSQIAMKATMLSMGPSAPTNAISQFLKNFVSARALLSAYAEEVNTPKPVIEDTSSFWRKFLPRPKETGAPPVDLNEAIDRTKDAGDHLNNLLPVLEKTETLAAGKMAVCDYIADINDKIGEALDRHIKVGEIFITKNGQNGGETSSTALVPSDGGATKEETRFEKKLHLLREMRAVVLMEGSSSRAYASLYEKMSLTFNMQTNIVVPKLTNQVATLYRTLDLLQSSAHTESMADVSTHALGEGKRDLLITAERILSAITATLDTTRANAEALQKEEIALLEKQERPTNPLLPDASPQKNESDTQTQTKKLFIKKPARRKTVVRRGSSPIKT